MIKAFLVAQREYLENIKTKGFWIGIMVLPLLYLMMFLVPLWLERTKAAKRFAVLDQSGWLLEAVEQRTIRDDVTMVLAAIRAGGSDLPAVPNPFLPLVDTIAELDESRLIDYANWLVSGDAAAGAQVTLLPGDARAAAQQREAVVTWWRELSANAAKDWPGLSKKRYVRIRTTAEDTQEDLNQRIADGSLFAYFVIGSDPVVGSGGSKYVSNNLTDSNLLEWFSERAGHVVRGRRLERESIGAETADWIQQPLAFEGRKVSASGEEEEVATQDRLRQWTPVVFVYILWLSIFSVTQMLLTNTIEEKSNRLIEVLLSSLSPIQLMAGKISGIALTGLTIVGTWMLTLVAGAHFLPKVLGKGAGINLAGIAGDPALIGLFLLYFLLGYLLYAAILVGIGSVCNSLKEAQNLMMPITLLLFVPLILMIPIGKDPNGPLAVICSYIPPLTPFVMLNRAAGPPGTLEYVLTTLILLASVAAMLWAAAKVFRIGILLTGKPPKFSEIIRWIKAPVGVVPARTKPEPQKIGSL